MAALALGLSGCLVSQDPLIAPSEVAFPLPDRVTAERFKPGESGGWEHDTNESAYRAGSSPEVDEAIRLHEPLEAFLRQRKDESASLADGYRQLAQILGNLETER